MTRINKKVVRASLKKSGSETKFFTRNQAIKYLQVSLETFRRLCILKGVFPRIPPTKFKGSNTTYYYRKDIAYIYNDPIIQKIRGIRAAKVHSKKLIARGHVENAKLMLANVPKVTLDHIVRERYPTFVDALKDLDDALTLVYLFAALPAGRIPVKLLAECKKLSHAWSAFVTATGALTKIFVSVKGYYYQAVVDGVKITWSVPHAFQQEIPKGIDIRIMATFIDLYVVLLNFVLYHLYTANLQASYPPKIPIDEEGGIAKFVADLFEQQKTQSNNNDDADEEENGSQGITVKVGARGVFKDMVVFVSREVPRMPVELCLITGGAKPIFDDAQYTKDESITHIVVDRPPVAVEGILGSILPGKTYIQPQWVFDSFNANVPLPVQEYKPGLTLPPHLSPFVEKSDYENRLRDGGYMPQRAKEIEKYVTEYTQKLDEAAKLVEKGEIDKKIFNGLSLASVRRLMAIHKAEEANKKNSANEDDDGEESKLVSAAGDQNVAEDEEIDGLAIAETLTNLHQAGIQRELQDIKSRQTEAEDVSNMKTEENNKENKGDENSEEDSEQDTTEYYDATKLLENRAVEKMSDKERMQYSLLNNKKQKAYDILRSKKERFDSKIKRLGRKAAVVERRKAKMANNSQK